MKDLSGIWEGEYSYNHGTESEPDFEYFPFLLHIDENDGSFSGTCEENETQLGKASIAGFVEGNFISFIKKYEKPNPEDVDYNSDEQQYHEVHYSGNYDYEDNSFSGVWEITVSADRVGFQEEYILENVTGAWYIRKL